MKYSNTLENLFNLQRRGIKLGLEHTVNLLNEINNPQNNFKCIHIAGTNGKGTTCAVLQNILYLSGKKVGLYTSPHLVRFNERIRVNGRPISDYDVTRFFKNIYNKAEKIKSTFFEVTTAMAFDYFNKQKVDIAVIETGLGGRLDSTNVISPELSVITPISYDHQNILGRKLETIAYEKAGIIKKNVPVIIGKQDKLVENVIIKKAKELNSKLYKIDLTLLTKINKDINGTEFHYKGEKYFVPLLGKHQVENSILAIESASIFDQSIKLVNFSKGVRTVKWPGRMEILDKSIYFDVSHNEKGIEVTIDTLKRIHPNKKLAGIMCLKKGKSKEKVIKLVTKNFKKIYIFNNYNELLLPANELYESLSGGELNFLKLGPIKNCIKNLKSDINEGYIGLIFGTHYIAEDIYKALEISFDADLI